MVGFNLSRFSEAQDQGVYESALRELEDGRKVGHWMWFIFPQIQGLGNSSTSAYYGIQNLEEARAYLSDPVLGARLIQSTEVLLSLSGCSAEKVFGYPDYLKFLSSLTLFEQASNESGVFTKALQKYYSGKRDQKTIKILKNEK